ncbi:hypothetical protein L3081_05990 [Colwellia sp. MSW7]|uniref:Uncharacterized protein n=1 Tax=Colwellia maritima TaxID=2912588 RepID=A0ABS9X0N9_9GAMM|nr:hypothetical protein [Colwellia maritima]MCI2283031.1 hypothetical protein [Colwellia maritima]
MTAKKSCLSLIIISIPASLEDAGFSELETPLGKALIVENGYSGEYAPAFSNKLHPCSVLLKINNAA